MSLHRNLERVDTVSMRFRATFTSLLTVLLLSLSSVASACEIKCDLARVGPSCHEARATEGQMQAMAGMDRQASAHSAVLVSAPRSCQHRVCANQPALLGERNGFIPHFAPSMAAVLPAFLSFAPAAVDLSIPVRGPPSFRADSPVSLHTTLRV